MKKFFSRIFSRRVLFVLQLLFSLVLIGALWFYALVPLKYFALIIVVLTLALLLLYRGERKDEKHHKRQTVYKVFNIVIIIALIFADYNVFKVAGFLDAITGANSSIKEFSVVVLKENKTEDLNSLKESTFGYVPTSDVVNMNQTLTMINDELETTVVSKQLGTHQESVTDLYNKTIDALIVNEMDRSTLEDEKETFSDDTVIVKTYQIKIPTKDANAAKVTQEAFSIFISGTDTYGDVSKASLSDVNMIATINPTTKQIYLTSIPRDYYVDIAGYNGKDKLTHSAKGGIDCTMDTIENFMGIDFNYYVKMNFTSFMKVIDEIGGITIDNPNGAFTTKIGKFKIKAGINELSSKEALAFVRERKAFADGDRVRGQNQQLMIKAIVKKLCSPSSITKLSGIFNAVASSLETNMTSQEIRSLINMELDDAAQWDVQSYHLNGTNDRRSELVTVAAKYPRGLYVMIPDQTTIDQAKIYIQQVMNNEIVKVEN